MRKILLFLLIFCSFITYSTNRLDYDELDKYISEKLDRTIKYTKVLKKYRKFKEYKKKHKV